MECWLKSSREEQGWGQQAAETDNKQVHGTSLTISSMFSLLHHLLSRPRLSGVRGRALDLVAPRRMFTWFWGVIWDLFGRRPCPRQYYASLSLGPLCSQGAAQSSRINAPFYWHLRNPSINTSNWQHFPFNYILTGPEIKLFEVKL